LKRFLRRIGFDLRDRYTARTPRATTFRFALGTAILATAFAFMANNPRSPGAWRYWQIGGTLCIALAVNFLAGWRIEPRWKRAGITAAVFLGAIGVVTFFSNGSRWWGITGIAGILATLTMIAASRRRTSRPSA
jgi:peptidoglycan/LPS O-acetylase OafA/YrhL